MRIPAIRASVSKRDLGPFTAPADSDAMLPEVCTLGRSLMEHELCSRFALDSYEREIERYGGPAAISLAEDLFVADSALVLELFRNR